MQTCICISIHILHNRVSSGLFLIHLLFRYDLNPVVMYGVLQLRSVLEARGDVVVVSISHSFESCNCRLCFGKRSPCKRFLIITFSLSLFFGWGLFIRLPRRRRHSRWLSHAWTHAWLLVDLLLLQRLSQLMLLIRGQLWLLLQGL